MPLGTRDGLLVEHNFPADGTYEINLNISSIPGSELRGYPYGWLEYEHTVAVTIDGAKVFADNIGGEIDSKALDQGQIKEVEAIKNRFRGIRVDVKAGRRTVGAAFVARSFAEGDYLLQSLVPGEGVPDIPRLFGMEIIGPFDPTGIAEPTREPRAHLQLLPAERERRASVRHRDSDEPRSRRLPPARHERGRRARARVLRARAARKAASRPASRKA